MYVFMYVRVHVCTYTQHVLCSVIERDVYLMCLFCGPHPMYTQYMYVPQSIIYLYKHMYVYAPSSGSRCNHCVHGPATACSSVPPTHAPYPSTSTVRVLTTSHTTDPYQQEMT